MTLGEKIKTLRTNRGLTQTELAKKINIHYTHIGKYENDLQNPSTDTIKKIADYFSVSVDYLLGDENKGEIKVSFEDEELLKQFKAIEYMPENDKNVIKELINAFLVKNQIKQLVR